MKFKAYLGDEAGSGLYIGVIEIPDAPKVGEWAFAELQDEEFAVVYLNLCRSDEAPTFQDLDEKSDG